ncbi:MAG TPA: hypothetical protein VK151_02140 [Fluviicola sp.]|nr:hypothetical protein [Fluviicola sp.]
MSMRNTPCTGLLVFLSSVCLVLLFSACGHPGRGPVKNGRVTLHGKQVREEYSLSGSWTFYNKQVPGKLEKGRPIHVPGLWIGPRPDRKEIDGEGYGTYQVTVLNPEEIGQLCLKVSDVSGCGEVFVNNKRMFRLAGFDKNGHLKIRKSTIVIPLVQAPVYDIRIFIRSNRETFSGGLLKPPVIGRYDLIQSAVERDMILDSASLLLLLFVALTCVFQYIFISSQKAYLYLTLFCLVALLNQLMVSPNAIYLYFDVVDSRTIEFIRFVSNIIPVMVSAYFFHSLYPEGFTKRSINVISLLGAGIICMRLVLEFLNDLHNLNLFLACQLYVTGSSLFLFYRFVKFRHKSGMGLIQKVLIVFKLLLLLVLIQGVVNRHLGFHAYNIQRFGFVIFCIFQVFNIIVEGRNRLKYISNLEEETHTLSRDVVHKNQDIRNLAQVNEIKSDIAQSLISELTEVHKQPLPADEKLDVLKSILKKHRFHHSSELTASAENTQVKWTSTSIKKQVAEKYPQLSNAEIEICLLVQLNYSYKEIAMKRNTNEQAIKMGVYRIRKKLGVSTNRELTDLLSNI